MKEYKYKTIANYKYYELFGTPVKQLILKFLYKNTGHKFSVMDLEKELGIPSSSLSKALSELNEIGLLERIPEGKFVYYELGKEIVDKFKHIFESLEKINEYANKNKEKL